VLPASVRHRSERNFVRLQRPLLVIALVAAPVVGTSPVASAAPPANEAVQLLAINDLHGHISRTSGAVSKLATAPGPDGVFGADAEGNSDDVFTVVGGAAHVATVVRESRQAFRQEAGGSAASFFVSVGDNVGTGQPESAAFKDEPTIEVLNAMGLDVSAVGNHELEMGMQELRRVSAATDGRFTDDVTACQGITPGVDGCFGTDEHAFTGANFPYLAANIVSPQTGEPVLPPYEVFFTPRGEQLALIGVTRESRIPEGTAGVEFRDEADAVNRLIPQLRADGIEAIGVLLHTGGERGPTARDPNGCDQLTGPVIDMSKRIDAAVDFLVTADTHDIYNCLLPDPQGQPRLVTQAGAYGQVVTDIRLTLDRATGDVDRAATYAATNLPVTRGTPDAKVQAVVDYWVAGPGNQSAERDTGAPRRESVSGTSPATYGLFVIVVLAALAAGTALWWQGRRRDHPSERSRPRHGRDDSGDADGAPPVASSELAANGSADDLPARTPPPRPR
jgi:5'-nucleotidase